MSLLPPPSEPDCWKLVGEDDWSTPPSLALVLHTAGTRPEWRQAGFPVLFDAEGQARPVQRAGREYRFERIDASQASALPHPPPMVR
jgi:hypothetical protein